MKQQKKKNIFANAILIGNISPRLSKDDIFSISDLKCDIKLLRFFLLLLSTRRQNLVKIQITI